MQNDLKSYFIYGKHSTLSALQNKNRKIIKALCTQEFWENAIFKKYILQKKFQLTSRAELDKLLGTNSIHQGIAIETMPITSQDFKSINLSLDQIIIIIDKITDQQNFGSILRSAVTFGVNTIITSSKHCVRENASLAKAASGALEFVNIVEVVNINQIIEILKKHHFWIDGLDHEGKTYTHQYKAPSKLDIVLGSEDQGISKLTKQKCDILIKIPMLQNQIIDSLNVGVATGICLYELFKSKIHQSS